MRALKIATIVMGVLIVLGTMTLVVLLARRSMVPSPTVSVPVGSASATAAQAGPVSAMLDEPAGTRIVGITATQDRLAVQLQGGGVDRIVLLDPHTGSVAGRVSLAR